MGIADIGAPGETLDDPALTLWQGSVRDVLSASDTPTDSRYLKNSGGTVTGTVTITGDLTAASVASAGGVTAGGKLTAVSDPTDAADGANKGYVDSRIWFGTEAEYDAIVPKDPTVLYCIMPG